MSKTAWLTFLSLTLSGCGSESEDSSSMDSPRHDDSEWLEDEVEAPLAGSFLVDLPGEHGSGMAACSINLTRAVNKRLASISLTLDVFGSGCDAMGNCSNPNMRSGQLNFSGGIDGDKPFGTMLLGYEPPSDSEEAILWMYNVLYKTTPFSRVDMRVDGDSFDVLTSDLRGADVFSKGPHVWNTQIEIEADMLKSSADSTPSTPGLQTRGEFAYEGPCEIYGKTMQL